MANAHRVMMFVAALGKHFTQRHERTSLPARHPSAAASLGVGGPPVHSELKVVAWSLSGEATDAVANAALVACREGKDHSSWPAKKSQPSGDGASPAPEPAAEPADWAGLLRYRPANAALAATACRPELVLIGDSIIEAWTRAEPQFFAHNSVNRGIGGQTSAQLLLRFRQDAVVLGPKVILLLVGTNDIAKNAGAVDLASYCENMQAMVQLARASGVQIVLGTIPPAITFYWRQMTQPIDAIREANAWLRDFARHGQLELIDYFAATVVDDGALDPRFSHDGVHPNAAGYAAMTALALPVLAAALERASAAG